MNIFSVIAIISLCYILYNQALEIHKLKELKTAEKQISLFLNTVIDRYDNNN